MGFGRGTTFTWLGHAGVELRTTTATSVLVDPWFGNPHSPCTEPDQAACDVLLITHGHFDHFNDDTIALARRLRPAMPCIHELSLHLAPLLGDGAEIIGMNKGGTVTARGLRISMVPANHSAGDLRGGESVVHLGEPVGFVLETPEGLRIYHAGDTTVFGDMALIRELHRPDVAILPIGGHFTMDPAAAALAVELLGARDVLPVHWGTFPILAGTPDALREAVAARGLTGVTIHGWAPGDTLA